MDNNEIYLVHDRIRRIKVEIKYLQDRIELNKSIISKFKELPSSIKNGLDEGTKGKSFISINEKNIELCNYQLNNLYKALKELESLK